MPVNTVPKIVYAMPAPVVAPKVDQAHAYSFEKFINDLEDAVHNGNWGGGALNLLMAASFVDYLKAQHALHVTAGTTDPLAAVVMSKAADVISWAQDFDLSSALQTEFQKLSFSATSLKNVSHIENWFVSEKKIDKFIKLIKAIKYTSWISVNSLSFEKELDNAVASYGLDPHHSESKLKMYEAVGKYYEDYFASSPYTYDGPTSLSKRPWKTVTNITSGYDKFISMKSNFKFNIGIDTTLRSFADNLKIEQINKAIDDLDTLIKKPHAVSFTTHDAALAAYLSKSPARQKLIEKAIPGMNAYVANLEQGAVHPKYDLSIAFDANNAASNTVAFTFNFSSSSLSTPFTKTAVFQVKVLPYKSEMQKVDKFLKQSIANNPKISMSDLGGKTKFGSLDELDKIPNFSGLKTFLATNAPDVSGTAASYVDVVDGNPKMEFTVTMNDKKEAAASYSKASLFPKTFKNKYSIDLKSLASEIKFYLQPKFPSEEKVAVGPSLVGKPNAGDVIPDKVIQAAFPWFNKAMQKYPITNVLSPAYTLKFQYANPIVSGDTSADIKLSIKDSTNNLSYEILSSFPLALFDTEIEAIKNRIVSSDPTKFVKPEDLPNYVNKTIPEDDLKKMLNFDYNSMKSEADKNKISINWTKGNVNIAGELTTTFTLNDGKTTLTFEKRLSPSILNSAQQDKLAKSLNKKLDDISDLVNKADIKQEIKDLALKNIPNLKKEIGAMALLANLTESDAKKLADKVKEEVREVAKKITLSKTDEALKELKERYKNGVVPTHVLENFDGNKDIMLESLKNLSPEQIKRLMSTKEWFKKINPDELIKVGKKVSKASKYIMLGIGGALGLMGIATTMNAGRILSTNKKLAKSKTTSARIKAPKRMAIISSLIGIVSIAASAGTFLFMFITQGGL